MLATASLVLSTSPDARVQAPLAASLQESRVRVRPVSAGREMSPVLFGSAQWVHSAVRHFPTLVALQTAPAARAAGAQRMRPEGSAQADERELRMLHAEADVREARASRDRMLLGAVSLGLALALFAAGTLWWTGRARRRASAALAEQVALAGQQKATAEQALARTERLLAERDLLVREVHHRVKNNLQVVAALVNLQAHALREGEDAREALAKMRARVESLALVHQRLYQAEDLRAVRADAYLADLVATLGQTIIPAFVFVESEAAPAVLDADTATPLGLIVTELVANAAKHAFVGRSSGRLRIALEDGGTGRLRIIVEDDGPGLPDGFVLASPNGSLGLRLVLDLAAQLEGAASSCRSNRLGGAWFGVAFSQPLGLPTSPVIRATDRC